MKLLCLFSFALLLLTPVVFSQGMIEVRNGIHSPLESTRWKLDKYMWSYTHPVGVKSNKSIFDFDAIDSWQRMGEYLSISPNGRYFSYIIKKGPDKWSLTADSLIVQSTQTSWRLTINGQNPGFFSDDNKQYIFLRGNKLCFLQLGKSEIKYVSDVTSYKVPMNVNRWLAYQKSVDNTVVLQDLVTGNKKVFFLVSDYVFDTSGEWLICKSFDKNGSEVKSLELHHLTAGIEKRFANVIDYSFAASGKSLLLKRKGELNEETTLEYVTFPEDKRTIIWSSRDDERIITQSLDASGEQVVFSIIDSSDFATTDLVRKSVWYYKKGMTNAIRKISNDMEGIDEGLELQGSASFTDNDCYIHFLLHTKPSPDKPASSVVGLEIWNHKDSLLQSLQAHKLKETSALQATFSLDNEKIIQIENSGKTLHLLQGNFAIIKKTGEVTYGDRFWEGKYKSDSNWLVDLRHGVLKLLGTDNKEASFWFSPGGNYLVYFNPDKSCNYFSYDLKTGKTTNISAGVSDSQLVWYSRYKRLNDGHSKQPTGLAAWLEDDAGLLVYDNNDIWRLDLQGNKAPINVTNGFGHSHGIIFSLFNSRRLGYQIPIVNKQEPLLLRAFNVNNKENGFYRKVIGTKGDPQLLSMGKYFMNMIPDCHDPNLSNEGMPPVKAKKANTWIIQRQSENDAPNYYKTTDLKSFEKLTNFRPQKAYNWLIQELHTFKHLDGKKGQGILYKPENFDSTRKYPVLIVIYGGFSDNLYQFRNPAYTTQAIGSGMSPIWYLNNGYLVFTPDIYVAPLRYGPEALNVIEGVARHLNNLPYVDSGKLACASHSWSGKLGAYIFTHSKSISATAISEGFLYGNVVSEALGELNGEGGSRLVEVEEESEFGSLWKHKDYWLDQTTVLNVEKSNNPLMLLCNNDGPYEIKNQTLQMFTALRRLEKKVWWLKYDQGGHNLDGYLPEQQDYTIRYTQYFDHFLKDAPAPRWMTKGIPASMKGIDMAYELDPSGSCSVKDDCKICHKWNEQYQKTPGMFTKPISEWHLEETRP